MVQKYLLPWQAFVGIGLIVIGFGGFAFAEFHTAWREYKHKVEENLEKEYQQKLSLNISQKSSGSCDSSPGPLLLNNDSNKVTKRNWKTIIIRHLI